MLAGHDDGLDPDTGHVELWPFVLERLAAAWSKAPVSVKRRLGLAYTGLPRGRVTRPDKSFLILHGDDAPIPVWKRLVLDRFQLSGRNVKYLFDEHETQIPGHPEALTSVFDRIHPTKSR